MLSGRYVCVLSADKLSKGRTITEWSGWPASPWRGICHTAAAAIATIRTPAPALSQMRAIPRPSGLGGASGTSGVDARGWAGSGRLGTAEPFDDGSAVTAEPG